MGLRERKERPPEKKKPPKCDKVRTEKKKWENPVVIGTIFTFLTSCRKGSSRAIVGGFGPRPEFYGDPREKDWMQNYAYRAGGYSHQMGHYNVSGGARGVDTAYIYGCNRTGAKPGKDTYIFWPRPGESPAKRTYRVVNWLNERNASLLVFCDANRFFAGEAGYPHAGGSYYTWKLASKRGMHRMVVIEGTDRVIIMWKGARRGEPPKNRKIILDKYICETIVYRCTKVVRRSIGDCSNGLKDELLSRFIAKD